MEDHRCFAQEVGRSSTGAAQAGGSSQPQSISRGRSIDPERGKGQPLARLARLSDDSLAFALIFVMLAAFACVTPAQNDTFWHLRSGQYMWQTGSVLRIERFSHTAFGSPLLNHWWLSQLAFYGLFQAGGAILLTLFAGTCAFSAVVGSYKLCRGSFELRLLLLAFLVVCTAPEWAIRPQVISLLLFVVSLHLLVRGRTAWLPLVCVLWANVHALVIFGVLVAGCAALEALIWSREHARRDAVTMLLCLAAPALSPIGWQYWWRVLETISMSKALQLQEYRMPLDAVFVPFWIAATLLVVLAVVRRRALLQGARTDRILLLVALATGVAGATAARNVAVFALAAAPILARLLAGPAETRRSVGRPVPTRVLVVMMTLALSIASTFVVVRWQHDGAALGWQPMSSRVIAAVRQCPDPLFNQLADGGYLMWVLPHHRVFIDSRMEAYPVSLLHRSRRADLFGEYSSLFEDYSIRCAIVTTKSVLNRRLSRDATMFPLYSDDTRTVYSRVRP